MNITACSHTGNEQTILGAWLSVCTKQFTGHLRFVWFPEVPWSFAAILLFKDAIMQQKIELVLTAHPTEAQRRSALKKHEQMLEQMKAWERE